jgi:hypothetical protein
MASGWGCQFLGKKDDIKEWCMRLNHECRPGCKGCIISGEVTFSQPPVDAEQERKVKKRSDNPLGER